MNRWILLITALICLLLGLIGGTFYSALTTGTIYAEFDIIDQDIGDVCPDTLITQSNFLRANGPALLNMAATIYDLKGNAYPPMTHNYWLAVPDARTIKDVFVWTTPSLPPNKYIRILAANSESLRPPEISTTHFSVVDNCTPEGKPIPTPAESP